MLKNTPRKNTWKTKRKNEMRSDWFSFSHEFTNGICLLFRIRYNQVRHSIYIIELCISYYILLNANAKKKLTRPTITACFTLFLYHKKSSNKKRKTDQLQVETLIFFVEWYLYTFYLVSGNDVNASIQFLLSTEQDHSTHARRGGAAINAKTWVINENISARNGTLKV